MVLAYLWCKIAKYESNIFKFIVGGGWRAKLCCMYCILNEDSKIRKLGNLQQSFKTPLKICYTKVIYANPLIPVFKSHYNCN